MGFLWEPSPDAGSFATGKGTITGNRGFDPKGLPTRPLGKVSINMPLLGFGLGSRWMLPGEEESLRILEYALTQGIFYWDTAATYKNEEQFSKVRVGKLFPRGRKEVCIPPLSYLAECCVSSLPGRGFRAKF